MVRKICPICDQVMSGSHYCENCRSWVKHPYVRDVTYYLNERHPVNESDCSYHSGLDLTPASEKRGGSFTPNENKMSGGVSKPSSGSWQPQNGRPVPGHTAKTAAPGHTAKTTAAGHTAKTAAPGHTPMTSEPGRPEPSERRENTRRKKNTAVLMVILILAVIKLLGSCASLGFEALNTIVAQDSKPEYDVDLGNFYGEEETGDTDYIELEAESVIAAGAECSRESHFAVSGKEFEGPLTEILKDYGLSVTDSGTYSYNEKYDSGDTWYATWITCYLDDGVNGVQQYAELDYDTGTEALHRVDITLEDPHTLAAVSGDIVELLEERGALRPGENCAELLRQEMQEELTRTGDYEIRSGDLEISGFFEGDSYFVSISRVKD